MNDGETTEVEYCTEPPRTFNGEPPLIRSVRWFRRPYGVWRIDTWKLCFERSERIRVWLEPGELTILASPSRKECSLGVWV
jgi:hypothetical protein